MHCYQHSILTTNLHNQMYFKKNEQTKIILTLGALCATWRNSRFVTVTLLAVKGAKLTGPHGGIQNIYYYTVGRIVLTRYGDITCLRQQVPVLVHV